MKDSKVKERFIELRSMGWSYSKIAEEIGTSKQTLISWSYDLTEQICNLRAVEDEALLKKHLVAKEVRLKAFSDLLSRSLEELGKRDLSQVETHRLVDLALKCVGFVSQHDAGVSFVKEQPPLFPDHHEWRG